MKPRWPTLQYADWKETYETLHRWLQMVGKIRLYKAPWTNHSWHATFYVTSRGLSSSAIPLGERNLTADFDLIDHKLLLQDSLGKRQELILRSETVASFYQRFEQALKVMGLNCDFDDHPNECGDYIRFSEDVVHKTYNPNQAYQFFQVLVQVNNVFQKFRANFVGKCSPVHLFWGSMDLAVTRFSGRPAPVHPGVAPHISKDVMREAYSHEVSSAGFWAGNELYPQAAFYSYAYPTPPGFAESKIKPKGAFFHKELGEFLLPYELVQAAPNPEELVWDFLESTYEAAVKMGKWESDKLEPGPFHQQLLAKHGPENPSLH